MNTALIIFIILICAALAAVIAIKILRSPKNKGTRGEMEVSSVLGKTEHGKQYVINNLLFTPSPEQSCQIDHILINEHGIFVIETKNYSGSIYGGDETREWTQVLAYGNVKNKLYNPVKQNQTHIYHLSKYLEVKNVFINAVVFLNNADISGVTSEGVYTLSGLNGLRESDTGINLTAEQMEEYYNKLLKLKNSSTLTEKQHVKNIRNKQKQLKKGICPRCGGRLVLHNGSNGKFYGCSNYPKCKFTINPDDVPTR